MKSNNSCGCISLRTMSICSGVLTMILWAYYTYLISGYGVQIFPMALGRSVLRTRFWIPYSRLSDYIYTSTALAISVLMVIGVIKKIINFILPWLAIHFTSLMYNLTLILYTTIITIFGKNDRYIWFDMIEHTLITGTLTFLWGVVYLFCKSLMDVSTQEQPAKPEEIKILETSDEMKTQPV